MARKRTGQAIHGWLAIDKPVGMTSTAVVTAVRRLTGAAKVGHGGTLDPLATGVLPVALGEGTKTVAFVMDGAKTYRFRVCWGEARSSDDREHACRGDLVDLALDAVVGDEEIPLGVHRDASGRHVDELGPCRPVGRHARPSRE